MDLEQGLQGHVFDILVDIEQKVAQNVDSEHWKR